MHWVPAVIALLISVWSVVQPPGQQVSVSASCLMPEISLSIAARAVAAMPDCLVDRLEIENIEAVIEAMSPRSAAAMRTSTRLNPFSLNGNKLGTSRLYLFFVKRMMLRNWRIG